MIYLNENNPHAAQWLRGQRHVGQPRPQAMTSYSSVRSSLPHVGVNENSIQQCLCLNHVARGSYGGRSNAMRSFPPNSDASEIMIGSVIRPRILSHSLVIVLNRTPMSSG